MPPVRRRHSRPLVKEIGSHYQTTPRHWSSVSDLLPKSLSLKKRENQDLRPSGSAIVHPGTDETVSPAPRVCSDVRWVDRTCCPKVVTGFIPSAFSRTPGGRSLADLTSTMGLDSRGFRVPSWSQSVRYISVTRVLTSPAIFWSRWFYFIVKSHFVFNRPTPPCTDIRVEVSCDSTLLVLRSSSSGRTELVHHFGTFYHFGTEIK